MFNSKIIDEFGYAEHRNGDSHSRSGQPNPTNGSFEEAEALLLLLETSVVELNKPMAVAMGLSEPLLSQTEEETPMAKDLKIVVNELRHVNEVVRGLNLLTQYESNSLSH